MWLRGGSEVWLYSFLTSALDWGDGTSIPDHFIPGKKTLKRIYKRLGRPQNRSVRHKEDKIISVH